MSPNAQHPVILFDGVCHLCHGFVRFVLERDPGGVFHFAPLQSEAGRALIGGRAWDSVVLLEGGRQYEAEEAVRRIFARLSGPWPWLGRLMGLVPRFVRAWGYRLIARHRYRLFGKGGECALPRPEWKGRFLS